jgi:HAD superfamily hydrolase (TIGR01549 family)
VWHRGIPELFAQKEGLDLSLAKELILQEYGKVGDGALQWYDIDYWFKHLGLQGGWEDLLKRYSHQVRVYPEVHEVLARLREKYYLIVLSNAAREFVDVEMREGELWSYFERVISATSDFCLVKKSHEFYLRICETLGIAPKDLIHVGDHWEFDYQIPRGMGIVSFYIDRKGERKGPGVIKDLRALQDVLDNG